jgi:sec-independent protein translocase protein TatB
VLDIGVTKLAIIGGIALVVIGPERLPGLARTIGTMLGRAQRYVADVKAEVGRSMELDELKKMKDTVESAARDVEQSMQTSAADFEKSWDSASQGLGSADSHIPYSPPLPEYRHPKKHWRVKQGATPQWFKARTGMRTKALSGAARVARFRPKKMG